MSKKQKKDSRTKGLVPLGINQPLSVYITAHLSKLDELLRSCFDFYLRTAKTYHDIEQEDKEGTIKQKFLGHYSMVHGHMEDLENETFLGDLDYV